MKKASDYYAELAQAGKKIEKDNAFRREYVEKMKRKPFPVKWIILSMWILSATIFYYRKSFIRPEMVQNLHLIQEHSNNELLKQAAQMTLKVVDSDLPAANEVPKIVEVMNKYVPTKNNVNQLIENVTSVGNAESRDPASKTAKAQNEYVYIHGKYYKKTIDNIYVINGRRIFYVDNRSKQATRSTNSVEENQGQDLGPAQAPVQRELAPNEKLKDFLTK